MKDDRLRSTPDTAWRSPGPGMYITFRCGACAKVKSCNGRKLKRIMGLRQYVCAGCAK
jgi:hypothetical protein